MGEKFFSLAGRLRYIDRWSLMRNTRRENVAEHSYITALIAHALCVIENELFGGKLNPDRAASLALYHDAAEVFTGDLPTPVKYYGDDIRNAYKSIENAAENKLLGFLPEKLRGEYKKLLSPAESVPGKKFVKYADKIAALIKCREELSFGNREFESAEKSTHAALNSANENSVRYFMENFADSFGLSLDDSL